MCKLLSIFRYTKALATDILKHLSGILKINVKKTKLVKTLDKRHEGRRSRVE